MPASRFQGSAASEQRRLFAGPLLPASLLRPGLLPVLPYPAGLRFQAVHADDLADAYVRAVVGDARGAFNVAADPVIDGPVLADLFDARPLPIPVALVRLGLAAGWRARLLPADPALLDLVLHLPLLDTTRIRRQLGWEPRCSGVEALSEMLRSLRVGAGDGTAPLAPDGPLGRVAEAAHGVGRRP